MSGQFVVVDLFAGPGGLAEGFSGFRSQAHPRPFSIALSVEKDAVAYETLRLRHFLWQFPDEFPREYYDFLNGKSDYPDWSTLYPDQWNGTEEKVLNIELGTDEANDIVGDKLDAIKKRYDSRSVLIGGPPCQIYSLAGRSRNAGNAKYNASTDVRTTLYREYIKTLRRLEPAAFVLENVKGILSFVFEGQSVFHQIMDEIRDVGYRVIALCPQQQYLGLDRIQRDQRDFVVRTELHGVPQARHRVIVTGLRKDIANQIDFPDYANGLLEASSSRSTTVRDILHGMPIVRSGISKTEDNQENWQEAIYIAKKKIANLCPKLTDYLDKFEYPPNGKITGLKNSQQPMLRRGAEPVGIGKECPENLQKWIVDQKLQQLTHHETRSHMSADLERYFFSAVYAEVHKVSARTRDFPPELAPEHQNWHSGKFADRYRVQIWDEPSKTITCHIAKDGHYYIHPDPRQSRSLTVREVARLQTFPDNYYFKGNRTQQYIQVGNAVPPFLAMQIAEALYKLLLQATESNNKIAPSPLSNEWHLNLNITSKPTKFPYPYNVTDDQWRVLAPLLMPARQGRPRKFDLRKVCNGIFYKMRKECTWTALPTEFPPWKTVYQYFYRWKRNGTWKRVQIILQMPEHQMKREYLRRLAIQPVRGEQKIARNVSVTVAGHGKGNAVYL